MTTLVSKALFPYKQLITTTTMPLFCDFQKNSCCLDSNVLAIPAKNEDAKVVNPIKMGCLARSFIQSTFAECLLCIWCGSSNCETNQSRVARWLQREAGAGAEVSKRKTALSITLVTRVLEGSKES